MKGSLIWLCLSVIQLSEFGTNGQILRFGPKIDPMKSLKPTSLGKYVYNRMVNGAHNIMQWPSSLRRSSGQASGYSNYKNKPTGLTNLMHAESSQITPQYTIFLPPVPQRHFRTEKPYKSPFGSQAEESYPIPEYQAQGGYTNHAPAPSVSYSTGKSPSYSKSPTQSYNLPNRIRGNGWSSNASPIQNSRRGWRAPSTSPIETGVNGWSAPNTSPIETGVNVWSAPNTLPIETGVNGWRAPNTSPIETDVNGWRDPDNSPIENNVDGWSAPNTSPIETNVNGWRAPNTSPIETNVNGWRAPNTSPIENNVDGWSAPNTSPIENDVNGRSAPNTPPIKNGGYGWGASKVCKLNEAPSIIINSAADIPVGSILRDAYSNVLELKDVVINPIPTPPNVLSVGIRNRIPLNYTLTYVERVDVNLNYGNNNVRSFTESKSEAHYSGNIRRPPSNSMLHTNNQRPKPNSFQIETFTVQTPNNSAPIDGLNNINGFFQSGIAARQLKFPNRNIRNHLETQLRSLGRIFNNLNIIEDTPVLQLTDFNSFSGETQVDAPLLGIQIQRITVPEPNSGERGILDAYFNFGLPVHPIDFVDISNLVSEQYVVLRNLRPQVSVTQLGSSSQEISDNLTDWIRGYVRNFRKASSAAYIRGEEIAYEGFRQDQFFIFPPGECPRPIDPPSMGGTTNMQTATGGVCMKGPPPSCIPPQC